MEKNKAIIFSGPSGSGRTTLVRFLLKTYPERITFSVSATTRPPRGEEKNGVDYYFISEDEFKSKIETNDFLEWEEVYKGRFYGTLKTEAKRIWDSGKIILFDIDVEGGLNLKKQLKLNALSVFVMPPSIKILEERLRSRNTDSEESVSRRIEKAEKELKTASLFDKFIINENLEKALAEADKLFSEFLLI